jgi:hypothetical protein
VAGGGEVEEVEDVKEVKESEEGAAHRWVSFSWEKEKR